MSCHECGGGLPDRSCAFSVQTYDYSCGDLPDRSCAFSVQTYDYSCGDLSDRSCRVLSTARAAFSAQPVQLVRRSAGGRRLDEVRLFGQAVEPLPPRVR